MMFYKFDEMETMRLNTGVRGRLVDRLKYIEKDTKDKKQKDILKGQLIYYQRIYNKEVEAKNNEKQKLM